jgi:hypothetical protein
MLAVMHAQMDNNKKPKTKDNTRPRRSRGHIFSEAPRDDVEQFGQRIDESSTLDSGHENLGMEPPNDFYHKKWHAFVYKMTSKDVGLSRSWEQIPNSIGSVFDKLESSKGLILTPQIRKTCYHQFTTKASSLGTIQFSDIEELLSQPALEIVLPIQEIRQLIMREKQSQSNDLESSEADPHSVERDGDVYSFQRFAAVVADARHISDERARALRRWSASAQLRAMFPIDPEATGKQVWDAFMLLLLLYCSFSVPYEIAFMETSPPELELFEILVPRPF